LAAKKCLSVSTCRLDCIKVRESEQGAEAADQNFAPFLSRRAVQKIVSLCVNQHSTHTRHSPAAASPSNEFLLCFFNTTCALQRFVELVRKVRSLPTSLAQADFHPLST
jgi:hypothetical protein